MSLSLVLHTLGSTSVSHCRFMLARIASTSMRCIFGNEHVIKEKELFFSSFFFYCWTASQSSDTRLFTPWYIHSSKKKLYIQWRLRWRLFYHDVVVCSFFSFLRFFLFFFSFFCFIWLFYSGVSSTASVTPEEKKASWWEQRRRRRKRRRIFSIFCSFAFGTALSVLCLGKERSDKNDKRGEEKTEGK